MTRLELQKKLDAWPHDSIVEVCVRSGPEEATDYEVADVGPAGASWIVISLGEIICTHA